MNTRAVILIITAIKFQVVTVQVCCVFTLVSDLVTGSGTSKNKYFMRSFLIYTHLLLFMKPTHSACLGDVKDTDYLLLPFCIRVCHYCFSVFEMWGSEIKHPV